MPNRPLQLKVNGLVPLAELYVRPRKHFLRMAALLTAIPRRPVSARSAVHGRPFQLRGFPAARNSQITGSVQAATSQQLDPEGPPKACSWLALRASVLRRPVSPWARPNRMAFAARASAGRELQCLSSYRAATRVAALRSRRQYSSCSGFGLQLPAAIQAWPNRPLNRNANGGLPLRAPAASSAPFGVRLAPR